MIIVLTWLGVAKSLDGQFTALRREEELEKEMEIANVKIPVVSQNEGRNGSLTSGSSLSNSTGNSSKTSSLRNV